MPNNNKSLESVIEHKALQEIWDRSGDCTSCGWHSFVREHDVTEEELIEDLKTSKEKYVELGCNCDEPEGHRGVFLHVWDFRNLVKLFKEMSHLCLTRAIELVPEERQEVNCGCIDECDGMCGKSFNDCRTQTLSRLQEELTELGK